MSRVLAQLSAWWREAVRRGGDLLMLLVQRRLSQRDRSDRNLLAVLARRMDAYNLPLPQVIFPGRHSWSIKLRTPMDMVFWGAALGFGEASPVALVRSGLTRRRWRMAGKVRGIPVELWAAYEREPGTADTADTEDGAEGEVNRAGGRGPVDRHANGQVTGQIEGHFDGHGEGS